MAEAKPNNSLHQKTATEICSPFYDDNQIHLIKQMQTKRLPFIQQLNLEDQLKWKKSLKEINESLKFEQNAKTSFSHFSTCSNSFSQEYLYKVLVMQFQTYINVHAKKEVLSVKYAGCHKKRSGQAKQLD